MQRGFLVFESEGKGGRRVPVSKPTVVGRTTECDLMIRDSEISRRHIRITPKKGRFLWEDLGSTNGTRVNGLSMLGGELKSGDRIEIGGAVLRFETEEVPDEPEQRKGTPLFLETIFDDAGSIVTEPSPGQTGEMLNAVYTVMNAIASNYEPCNLVDRILETTIQAVHAQRGAIFFAKPGSTELLPCQVCGYVHLIQGDQLRHAAPGEIQISGTVAKRVLEGGESVLFQNVDTHAELKSAESIVSLGLRSILCVPVRGKFDILGILYMDTDRSSRQYSRDDLLLTTAVGNSAGLALENAAMHRDMLEKQRMEQEIEYAWIIQEGFLVKEWPERAPGYEVYGETRPAKTVGGDFYDYITPRPSVVGILVGDVSGKGMPAALTMAQLLAEFRIHARDLVSPADVLKALNDDLVARSRRGTFCTLCYLTVDLETGRVLVANAGHLPVLRVSAEKTELFGDPSGPPAGIFSGVSWRDVESTVARGDTLVLYTDGIVEARSMSTRHGSGILAEPDEYGIETLSGVAGGQHGRPPRSLIQAVMTDVRRFCEPSTPHDDCTAIALRYLGTP